MAPPCMSKPLCGILLLFLSGTVAVCEVVASRVLVRSGWPYYHLGAGNLIFLGLAFSVARRMRGERLPHLWEVKWITTRALLGSVNLLLAVYAVQIGSAAGDVAALMSINVVVAALLAHFLLGERLRCIHSLALVCSFAGSVLIAQPNFIFGDDAADAEAPNAWVGNFLAVLAGLCLAANFICARKAPEAPGLFSSVVVSAMGAVSYLAAPPLFGWEQPMDKAAAEPGLALALCLALMALTTVRIFTSVLGAQLAPAAVGATTITMSTTVAGYVLQFLLFRDLPDPLTASGAVMVVAVVVMAGVRVRAPAGEPELDASAASGKMSEDGAVDDDAGSLSSFVSFVASEYAEVGGHRGPVRQRRHASASMSESEPRAGVVGVGFAVAVAV
mmetsp:Transcript_121239/g.339525  ORF Transcript_121239/g.339525 Transcript_121239/m.339525 type:complete len:388 (-) Transcript_121239:511-1674(-)